MSNDVGKLIKERRNALNLTLEEIGNYVGTSKATVQRWESGEIQNMRRDRIEKLAEILQISPADIIYAENNKPKPTPNPLRIVAFNRGGTFTDNVEMMQEMEEEELAQINAILKLMKEVREKRDKNG